MIEVISEARKREVIEQLLQGTPEDIAKAELYIKNKYLHFEPRPDDCDNGDEQTSFISDEWEGVKCVLAGNAAGKTRMGLGCWQKKYLPDQHLKKILLFGYYHKR